MRITILGPNLSAEAQRRGNMHIHAEGCGDVRQYGRGRRFGGETRGWSVEARTRREAVLAIYADHMGDEGTDDWRAYDDLHIAPCVNFEGGEE